MPAGYVHLNIWRRYLRVITFIALGLTAVHWQLGLGVFLGYLLGYYIDPDLDQIGLSAAEGRWLDDFKILGALFIALWIPYGYLAKHRGASHLPVVGTLSRWVYLLGILGVVIRPDYNQSLQTIRPFLAFLGSVFLGNCISDVIHSGADFGYVKVKRKDLHRWTDNDGLLGLVEIVVKKLWRIVKSPFVLFAKKPTGRGKKR